MTTKDEVFRFRVRVHLANRSAYSKQEFCEELEKLLHEALAEQDVSLIDDGKTGQEPVIGDEWTPCVKLPVTVHVRKQREGETHVSTREGITPVKPDDLIMRGVSGEEYPIGREIFENTYRIGKAPQPAPAVQQETYLQDIASFIGVGGYNGATSEQLAQRIRDEFVRLTKATAVQPLTDAQIHELDWPADVGGFTEVEFIARQVEAAHGIGAKE